MLLAAVSAFRQLDLINKTIKNKNKTYVGLSTYGCHSKLNRNKNKHKSKSDLSKNKNTKKK